MRKSIFHGVNFYHRIFTSTNQIRLLIEEYVFYVAGKVKSEFALGSEKMLNDLKELDQIPVGDLALSEHHQTPDPFGYYKNMATNVMRKTQPKSGKLRKKSSGLVNKNKPKTTPIIILEREK